MAVREIEIEQDDLTGMASRKAADQVERKAGPARPTLGRIQADDCGLIEEHPPGRLHSSVGKYSVPLVSQPAQLVEEAGIAGDNRAQALPVERYQPAVRLRYHGCLLVAPKDAGSLSEEVAGAQHGHRDRARRPLDYDPAAAALDEEDGVARLALVDDRAAGRDHDLPDSSSELPDRALGEREENGSPLQDIDPLEHGVEWRPAAVGLLVRCGERPRLPLAVQHRRRVFGPDGPRSGHRQSRLHLLSPTIDETLIPS